MKKFAALIDNFNNKLGIIVSWFTGLLVLTVIIDVFTRYLLNNSFVALQELEWHFFSIIFLLGSAYTLNTDNHVRVDLFYSNFSEKNKAIINLAGSIIFLIPFCLLVIYASKNFVFVSFNIAETSPDPGGLPARYILKSILPISFFFLFLQSLSLFFKSLLIIKENKDN